ncbi:MAG: insulinase family protein [Pseudoflavonifractor sp.]|nr:insulinase family protein [Alloprevotella sp.]MCM1117517.1 insulinase family protein [Pseudoflavonifractor sp.]
MAGMLLAQSLLHGAGEMDAAAFSEVIEGAGAWVIPQGGQYSSEMDVKGLRDTASEVIDALGAMLACPRVEEANFEAYREAFAQRFDVRLMESPFIASDEAQRHYWGRDNGRYIEYDTSKIRAVTREDVLALHRCLVKPESILLYVSGAVDDALMTIVEETMGRYFPQQSQPVEPALPEGLHAPAVEVGDYRVKGVHDRQAAIHLSMPAVHRSHPDYCLLRMAITGLGGYFGSRLSMRLREEMGLTYGIRAGLLSDLANSQIDIHTECVIDKATEALDEIRAEARRFVAEPPRGEELERLRRYMTSTLAESLDTPFKQLDWAVTFQSVGTDRSYFDRNQDAIFGATPERLADVMERHFPHDRQVAVIVD